MRWTASTCQDEVVNRELIKGSRPWSRFTLIGLDLAKHVFQVHGVDRTGKVSVRKQLRRAAGSSKHYRRAWSAWRLRYRASLGPGVIGPAILPDCGLSKFPGWHSCQPRQRGTPIHPMADHQPKTPPPNQGILSVHFREIVKGTPDSRSD